VKNDGQGSCSEAVTWLGRSALVLAVCLIGCDGSRNEVMTYYKERKQDMKKVLIALLLGSLLLFVQAYAVSAGSVVWTRTVDINCGPLRAMGAIPSNSNYWVGDTMKWTVDTTGAGAFTVDFVTIQFPAPNPWSATVPVTQDIYPGTPWTSSATTRDNGVGADFEYYITRDSSGTGVQTVSAYIGWTNPKTAPPVPSLSTWAVLILVLGLIAVSIALLRKRIRVGS